MPNLLDMLKGKSKNTKQATLDFVRDVFPTQTIDNIDELEGYDYSSFDVEDQKQLREILDKSYPRYIPLYIYKMNIKVDTKIFESQIKNFISEKSEFVASNKYKMRNFETAKTENVFSVKMVLDTTKTEIGYDGNIESTTVINSEDLKIYFYYDDNVLLINTGKVTLARIIYLKFLLENFHDYISLEPIKISNANLENIKTSKLEYDKVSILMLELLTNKLSTSKVKVNDYKKCGISNKNGERVKDITLRGHELDKETDVADRMNQGFCLKSVEIQLRYTIDSDNTYDMMVAISIQDTLKVTIIEGQGDEYNYKLIYTIYRNVEDLMEEELKVENIMKRYFPTVLSNRLTQRGIFLENMKDKVQHDDVLKSSWDKIEVWIKELY